MKTVNFIVYMPGQGGVFTGLVLSLDESTYPWAKPSDINVPRKDFYSFGFLEDGSFIWLDHHNKFPSEMEILRSFADCSTIESTLTLTIHPKEFYMHLLEIQRITADMHVTYSYIHASEATIHDHINSFVTKNNFRVFDRPKDVDGFGKFLDEYQPFKISLDEFFGTEEMFLDEYHRINDFFGLSNHDSDALEFYRSWRLARQTDRTMHREEHLVRLTKIGKDRIKNPINKPGGE